MGQRQIHQHETTGKIVRMLKIIQHLDSLRAHQSYYEPLRRSYPYPSQKKETEPGFSYFLLGVGRI